MSYCLNPGHPSGGGLSLVVSNPYGSDPFCISYRRRAVRSCFMFDEQMTVLAVCLDRLSTGISMASKRAIRVITTSSSISVNAERLITDIIALSTL